ncbi:MAG: PEP-CTERM sorting domain-containing protein, partial [Terrimicrobiaceae bacterium]
LSSFDRALLSRFVCSATQSLRSIDFGANWTDGAALSAPLRMSITATAVPEPGTITLLSLVTLALAARALRRKKI